MKQIRLLITGLVIAACGPSLAPTTVAPAATEPPPTAAPTELPTRTPRPTLVPTPVPTLSPQTSFLERPSGEVVRVMNYNVNWDAIFSDEDGPHHSLREFDKSQEFVRVMKAVNPDIVCLQEIHHLRKRADLGQHLAEALGVDETWQVANVRDNVIATRFGLTERGYELVTGSFRPELQQAAALIDLPDERFGESDLYMICSHFKSAGGRSDILLRWRQADVIMSSVRDFLTPGDNLDLPAGTPFILAGDFNIYDTDPHLHLRTLTQGDINDEAQYGEDLSPDWDGTELADPLPSHNGLGELFYTWRNDAEPFNPGPLDRVIYSDSVLEAVNAFVLNTTLLSDEALSALGLERYDVVLDPEIGNYDHLPIVVDFVVKS